MERSLLGLLDSIDYDRYDVDLFLMRHSGELMPYLNPKAKLLPEIPQYASLAVPMASLVKSGQLGVLRGRLKGKLAARHFDKQHPSEKPSVTALTYSHKYTLNSMPPISGKTYDLAISFLTPHYFARERVRASIYIMDMVGEHYRLFRRKRELDALFASHPNYISIAEATGEYADLKPNPAFIQYREHPVRYIIRNNLSGGIKICKKIIRRLLHFIK